MRVLITGGGGFVGSHLVDSQLAQGHFVRVVDLDVARLEHVRDHPELELIEGDVAEKELLSRLVEGIDSVYHLASAHLDVSLSADVYRQVNVEATKNLLAAAKKADVKKVVHCSTNGVVGEILSPPVDEKVACHPTNIYEETKLQGEEAARSFVNATRFPVVIVRPAWVYGPRCPRTQKLMDNIRKGRFPMFGSGQTLRHPVFITDAVKGLELCGETRGNAGQTYFIAGEKAVTIEYLVNTIAKVQGARPPSVRLPLSVGKLIGHGMQFAFRPLGKQPPFSRRSVDFYLKTNSYDISKAKRELGYQPQVNLHQGLMKILSWQADNHRSFYAEVQN